MLAVDILAAAWAGEPYGVGEIEVKLEFPLVGAPLPMLQVTDAEHRVLFPVGDDIRTAAKRPSEQPVPEPGRGRLLNRIGNLIREIASDEEDLQQTVSRRVMFVFRGSAPLVVEVRDSHRVMGQYKIVPQTDLAGRNQMLGRWWERYTATSQSLIENASHAPLVETYMIAMLSGRLGLPLPDWFLQAELDDDRIVDTLKLVAGAEDVSVRVFREVLLRGNDQFSERAVPIPSPPNWISSPSDLLRNEAALAAVETEPMASRVPPECFYIRHGSFANYLWFRDLASEFGGDISQMITRRSFRNDTSARLESQLNVQTTELSRMLGPSVIEDQAIIGQDLYISDGASLGVLFKASQPFLLRTSLMNERQTLARTDDSVSLEAETILGRTVSVLRTPDHRVCSYLVEDKEYFLVANNRALVERFLQVADGAAGLSSTTAFRLARQLMPIARGDTLFAYFSPEMLQNLVSPKYMIELRRRMVADSEIALVHLARAAATAEGKTLQSAEELIEAGYLPTGFGTGLDGSGVITVGDQVMDSRRGMRGAFQPIADVEISSVTEFEARWYEEIAAQYSTRFARLDPIMVGLRRDTSPDVPGIDRLTIHAEIAPWEPGKYGKLSQYLGPPTQVALQFAPDDIVAVQAHVASETLGPPTHLFAAIKDTVPPAPDAFNGVLKSYFALRNIPGYLGAWPYPGLLDRVPLGLGRGEPVAPGMSRLIGGLYRYTGSGFSIVSFQPDVLQASLPHIVAIDVPDSAQVRAHVGNLMGSRLEGYVNGLLYSLAEKSSLSSVEFLNTLALQLRVPPDQVLAAAKNIFGSEMQCPLGGEYEFDATRSRWRSTQERNNTLTWVAPAGYVAPILTWFRGLSGSLTQYNDRLVTDVVMDVARKPQ